MNNFEEYIKNNKILNLIQPHLQNKQTYIVGGYLRDVILGRESSDIDIVTFLEDSKTVAQKLAKNLKAYLVTLDETNQIYRIVLPDKITYIDIAQGEGKNIEEDLLRRDFSINALGYDLYNKKIIDVTNSISDIHNKIIREISKKNIEDDPIRMLRAYRFQSELGFEISESLNEIIKNLAKDIEKSAKERINTELTKLFAGEHASKAITAMDATKILHHILPECEELKKIPPNSHHHLCLFNHCISVTDKIEEFIKKSPEEVKKHFEAKPFGSVNKKGYLKLAAFLHDIGKPKTWTIEPETGRHRFIKHDDVGAKLAPQILKRLKFSNKQIKYIQKLIKYHIYPANVVTGENYTEKAVLKFFRKMEDDALDVIAIAYSDRLSALGPDITEEMVTNNINGLWSLVERYLKIKNELAPLPKLLDGNEIMQILGIKAGPQLGKIIKALKEAQLSSEVQTKDDAIMFIKKLGKN